MPFSASVDAVISSDAEYKKQEDEELRQLREIHMDTHQERLSAKNMVILITSI